MAGKDELLLGALGYRFQRPEMLADALTHPSTGGGRAAKRRSDYERLEFLGDRVLGLVVAEMLFTRFPDESEGSLARRHAALVRREAVARVALSMGLDRALLLSKGEEEGGGRQNLTMLGDACEAVLGAVFADGGLAPAAAIIHRYWQMIMDEAISPPKDAKTALQEWAQGLGKALPDYKTLEVTGPPHEPVFLVTVTVDGFAAVTGRGSSKRAAEQAAAETMIRTIQG
ncbi:MAG TPA: ribonuclease III [Rhodospirillaceae bacterium]|nr:ribonuclease III [Rhodospirillaceae bacterium]